MFAAAALAVAVVLFVKFAAFRKFTLVVAVVAVVGIAVLLGYFHEQNVESARKREAAKSLVAQTSLDFQDMRLGRWYGRDYQLTGRVKNNSQYTVTAITVRVLISDCDSNGHCDVVGDKVQECYLEIPPGQARDLSKTLFMRQGTEVRHTMQWSYIVPDVSAKE